MFSLTLGFIVFLSIAARLPFYKEYNDYLKKRGTRGLDYQWSNLPKEEIDYLLRKYEYAIDASGAVTSDMYDLNNYALYVEREEQSFRRLIDRVEVTDVTRRKKWKVGVWGITPT